MCLLWPTTTAGRPGRLAPVTPKRGAVMATWNHGERNGPGSPASAARIDPPPATLDPLMAHALPAEVIPVASPAGNLASVARMAAAARATEAEGATAAPARAEKCDAAPLAAVVAVPMGDTPRSRYGPGSQASCAPVVFTGNHRMVRPTPTADAMTA